MYLAAGSAEVSLYHGLIIKNQITNLLSAAILVITLITGFCMRYYNKVLAIYAFEYLLIILFLGYVSTLLIVSNHIVCTAILMELYGVLLIILAVVNKRSKQSTESGTKYYILSSFASIMLLLGVALLYVTTSLTYYQDLFTFLNFFFSNSHTLEDK
jgi:NADH-quinone oxidoreductase subunit N